MSLTRAQLARMMPGELVTRLVAAERVMLTLPAASVEHRRARTDRARMLAEIRRRDDAIIARQMPRKWPQRRAGGR